jgi:hypothetical protein
MNRGNVQRTLDYYEQGFQKLANWPERKNRRQLKRPLKPLLTDRIVEALPPAERNPYIVYDGGCQGFGVKVNASGRRTFVLNYSMFDGQKSVERRMVLVKQGDVAKARLEALKARELIRQGIDPKEYRRRRAARLRNVSDFQRWMDEQGTAR